MGTNVLYSAMAMGRRPIAESGLFSLVPIEKVHSQGGVPFLGGGGALFRSSLWFIGMRVFSSIFFISWPHLMEPLSSGPHPVELGSERSD
jgi:hypothetical protein